MLRKVSEDPAPQHRHGLAAVTFVFDDDEAHVISLYATWPDFASGPLCTQPACRATPGESATARQEGC